MLQKLREGFCLNLLSQGTEMLLVGKNIALLQVRYGMGLLRCSRIFIPPTTIIQLEIMIATHAPIVLHFMELKTEDLMLSVAKIGDSHSPVLMSQKFCAWENLSGT